MPASSFDDHPRTPLWDALRWVSARAAAIIDGHAGGPGAMGVTVPDRDGKLAGLRQMASGLDCAPAAEDLDGVATLLAHNIVYHGERLPTPLLTYVIHGFMVEAMVLGMKVAEDAAAARRPAMVAAALEALGSDRFVDPGGAVVDAEARLRTILRAALAAR